MAAEAPDTSKWKTLGVGLGAGLVVGLVCGIYAVPAANPQTRATDANLYVQTAAEFRACCLQTYRWAGERLAAKLKGRGEGAKPPAVVMDLDETVFDNSPFQSGLYEASAAYSDERWAVWEEKHAEGVLAVPGSLEFIKGAEAAGATVVYISNRKDKLKQSTFDALKHLGVNVEKIDDRYLGATGTSDKTERRATVAKKYDVVMLVGDNLRDFSDEFRAAKVDKADDVEALKKGVAARFAAVEKHRAKFGDEWVILPNPSYGEWMKLEGKDPPRLFRPSGMK